jgi:hypothetical protein
MGGPPPIDAITLGWSKVAAGDLKAVDELMMMVDATIEMVDQVLQYAQPIQDGAIRIKWREGTNGKHKAPRIVKWNRDKRMGKWVYVEISRDHLVKRTKTGGDFHEHSEKVREALGVLDYLLEVRSKLIKIMRNFRDAVGRLAPHHRPLIIQANVKLMKSNMALKATRDEREARYGELLLQQNREARRKKNREIQYDEKIVEDFD